MSAADDPDLSTWSLEQLNSLALAVYDGVEGVAIVPADAADDLAPHGWNEPADKVQQR